LTRSANRERQTETQSTTRTDRLAQTQDRIEGG
jgi:hypothetical protein